MHRHSLTGLLLASALLTGCAQHAEAPLPTHFPSDQQAKLQAASHWQLIAEDSARQLIKAMPNRRPLYVTASATPSPFEQAFVMHLSGILANAGYPVMKHAGPGTLQVDVSSQPLRFSANRQRPAFGGEFTALAGGLWVLRNLYENVSPGAAVVAGAVALDATRWLGAEGDGDTQVPRTELIVTTRVSDSERYYAQVSNAYYTTQSDWALYARSYPLPVKGGN